MRHVFISIATSAIAVIGLSACGGGGSDDAGDKKAISGVAKRVLTTKDENVKCATLVTGDFVTRVYGDAAQCLKAEQPDADDRPATSVDTSDVTVSGDKGTVRILAHGGDQDGATGTFTLRKQDGGWRIDELGTDYLRSAFDANIKNSSDDTSALRDPQVGACASKTIGGLSDAELRRVAYLSISKRSGSEEQLTKLLGPCLTSSTGGSGHVSALRSLFEKGVTDSARKDGLSTTTISCITKRLRTEISDQQILKLAGSGGKSTPALTRVVLKVIAACGTDSSKGASFVRKKFEAGVRRGFGSGVPKKVVDCVIRKLRSTISDKQIIQAAGNTSVLDRLKSRGTEAAIGCRP